MLARRYLSGASLHAFFDDPSRGEVFQHKCDGVESTHYNLNGGVMVVQDEHHAKFVEAVGLANARGECNFIVERRTRWFRLHVDFDLMHEIPFTGLSVEQELDMFRTVQSTVTGFFAEEGVEVGAGGSQKAGRLDFKMVVERGPPKKVSKGAQSYVKQGYHLKWPGVVVDSRMALSLRARLVHRFEEYYGARGAWNRWRDVFDDAVYTTNGLRMPGQCKPIRCAVCSNDNGPRQACTACGARGWVRQSAPYSTVYVLGEDGELDEGEKEALADPLVHASRLSTRVVHGCPHAAMTDESRAWVDQHVPSLGGTPARQLPEGAEDDPELVAGLHYLNPDPGEGDLMGKISPKLVYSRSDRRTKAAADFVTKHFPTFYKDLIGVKLTESKRRNGGDSVFWLTVAPKRPNAKDARYCMNIQGYHRSSTVYFQFTRLHACQRCFSKKKEPKTERARGGFAPGARRSVCCKEPGNFCCCCYYSPPVQLTPSLRKLLYGDNELIAPQPDQRPDPDPEPEEREATPKLQFAAASTLEDVASASAVQHIDQATSRVSEVKDKATYAVTTQVVKRERERVTPYRAAIMRHWANLNRRQQTQNSEAQNAQDQRKRQRADQKTVKRALQL